MNLLAETTAAIRLSGHTVEDVCYIGSREGYACTWDEFSVLADREYDDGYGTQEVADDLEVHFQDGGWIERAEYDGSEWWVHRRPLVLPTVTRPITRLFRGDDYATRLSEMNEENPDG